MKLELIRHAYLDTCTLGWLHANGILLATMEDRWIRDPDGPGGQAKSGNLHESCVPDGLYTLSPHVSAKYPQERHVWRAANPQLGVWNWPGDIPQGIKYGRSAILIHGGNTDDDSLGCILVGRDHLIDGNRHRIRDSQAALADLRAILGATETHQLLIRPTTGTTEM